MACLLQSGALAPASEPCFSFGPSKSLHGQVYLRRPFRANSVTPSQFRCTSPPTLPSIAAWRTSRRLDMINSGLAQHRIEPLQVTFCQHKDEPYPTNLENVANDGWMVKFLAFIEFLSSAFPVWVALACAAALVKPQAFEWIRGGWQIFGLTITMLGMGMTLSFDDFGAAFAMPKEVLAGVFLQYTVMPTAGAIISRFLQLPSFYAAGLILVSCCPGGTASNVVTYLARGNVALSVIMTSISTFLAVVMTPFLTAKLAGQYVSVDAVGLLMSTLQVVLLPVAAGVAMAHFFPKLVKKIAPFAPLVAILAVAGLCASAVAQNAQAILSSGRQVILAVVALHSAGFFFGFLLSKLLMFPDSVSRTISIEVGMQNSVLGVVLANQHFGNPLTAVPCAVSSVCHSIIGSLLAAFWRLITDERSTIADRKSSG